MNFLAHLFLSCANEYHLVGNFSADFLKPKELSLLPKEYLLGIELHRKIDYFTDNHPQVKKCTSLLHPTQGKYAPVVLDIFYDYLLYYNWEIYSQEKFIVFQSRVYQILKKHRSKLPKQSQIIITKMIKDSFLEKYISIEGLQLTFNRLERRLSFPSNMSQATWDLENHFDELNKRFQEFFPELIAVIHKTCNC